MKKIICFVIILLAIYIPADAENLNSVELSYTLNPYDISFSYDIPSFYSSTDIYDEVIQTIYDDLMEHKIVIGTINGVTMPVIYCDLTKHNITADTYDEFQEIIDNIFSKIDYDVINSHGEIFYTKSNVGILGTTTGGKYLLTRVAFEFNTELVNKGDSIATMNTKLNNLVKNFNNKCDEIIAQSIEPGMSDVEIVLALHDALMAKVSYDESSDIPIIDHRAYSAIIGDVTVCQGYTLAYMHLLEKVGIETKFIPSRAMQHAWNAVKLDNQWYHVDLTWDDTSNSNGSHRFFLVSDDKIQEHYSYESYHHDWEHVVDCSSTKYESGYLFNTPGFTTTYKKGYFWYIRNGAFYKSTINASPIQIKQSDFLPYKTSDISIYYPYVSNVNEFTFADKKSGIVYITLKNNTVNNLTVIPYLAVYNNDNSLEKIIPASEQTVPTGTKTININIKNIADSNQHIKIFLRQNDSFIYPNSNYIEIN